MFMNYWQGGVIVFVYLQMFAAITKKEKTNTFQTSLCIDYKMEK